MVNKYFFMEIHEHPSKYIIIFLDLFPNLYST